MAQLFNFEPFMMELSHLPGDILRYVFTFCDHLDRTVLWITAKYLRRYIPVHTLISASSVSLHAARRGYLTLLKWLHSNGWKLNAILCSIAASKLYLDTLQWLRSKGCAWDETVYRSDRVVAIQTNTETRIIKMGAGQWLSVE